MGLTGLIFAGIAVAWLAYLVPLYLRSRDQSIDDDADTHRFADSMRVIARGKAQLVDHDGHPLPEVEVSTPLTRRAAITDLHRVEHSAAKRRRRMLMVLSAVLSVVVALCALGFLPWVAVSAPAVMLVGFFVVARFSVRVMRRGLRSRYAAITGCSDEATVFLSREPEKTEGGIGLKLNAPVATGALWDPLPITVPTYVSRPLAPRTVRTIDLGTPDTAVRGSRRGRAPAPVTADAPAVEPVESPDVEVPVVPSTSEDERRDDSGEGRAATG